jgi:hypothetical protein
MVSNDLGPLPSRISASPSQPCASRRSSNSSAFWPLGWASPDWLGNGAPTLSVRRRGPNPVPAANRSACARRQAAAARARSGARRREPTLRPLPPRALRTPRRPRPGGGRISAPACRASAHSARSAPSSVFGPRDFAPFLRLASARALDTGTAARGDCPLGLGSGAPAPLRAGNAALGRGDFLARVRGRRGERVKG